MLEDILLKATTAIAESILLTCAAILRCDRLIGFSFLVTAKIRLSKGTVKLRAVYFAEHIRHVPLQGR